MKTPISYYGGKQSMLKYIMPLIPEHQTYVEPFFGGGAVFWAKEPVRSEVINDTNGNVVNFYEQLKNNYANLKRFIEATPYSRDVYRRAMTIYDCPFLFSPVERAWAFWVGTIQGLVIKSAAGAVPAWPTKVKKRVCCSTRSQRLPKNYPNG